MTKVLEEFQLPVGSLGQNRGAEGLHDFFNCDGLCGQLVSRGAITFWLA